MDSSIFQAVLEKGVFVTLFAGFFYWFLMIYLPMKDADHRAQMAQLQQTFKESLDKVVASQDKVVASFEKSTSGIITRLEIIETHIHKTKKK